MVAKLRPQFHVNFLDKLSDQWKDHRAYQLESKLTLTEIKHDENLDPIPNIYRTGRSILAETPPNPTELNTPKLQKILFMPMVAHF